MSQASCIASESAERQIKTGATAMVALSMLFSNAEALPLLGCSNSGGSAVTEITDSQCCLQTIFLGDQWKELGSTYSISEW